MASKESWVSPRELHEICLPVGASLWPQAAVAESPNRPLLAPRFHGGQYMAKTTRHTQSLGRVLGELCQPFPAASLGQSREFV